MRPNERFSGRGHARHVCKDCQKLGAEEFAYRLAIRNIDQMLVWETGRVKRKHRNGFASFLRHPNERIRRYAESMAARDFVPGVDEEDIAPWETELVWQEDEGRDAG
jgi:hypothetical protein